MLTDSTGANPFSSELHRGLTFSGRQASSRWRMKPSFIVIGAGKCGTTSLFNYLAQHPNVRPGCAKEVHYFDHNFRLGPDWYSAHFPLRHRGATTGEATPYYFCHPLAASRIKTELPDVRLVLMLRNPVDRARSQYNMACTEYGVESLSFEDALELEPVRLRGEYERLAHDPHYFSFAHLFYSYLHRGHYAFHLRAWLEHFPLSQIHIVNTEEFLRQPQCCYSSVLKFLGLADHKLSVFKKHNVGRPYDKLQPAARAQLLEHFRPHNEDLFSLLGRRINWQR